MAMFTDVTATMTLIDKYPHTGLIETMDRSGCQECGCV